MPAGPDVSVCSKEIMMVVDQTPIRCYPGSVFVLPPPAMCIMLPSFYDLFFFRRWPCLHEMLRGLVMFLYPTGAATPVGELEVRFIHNRFPASSPFQADGYSDRANFGKESIFIIIGTAAIGSVNIKRHSPLMIATIAATFRIRDNSPWLCASLSIQGILLCRGTQRGGFCFPVAIPLQKFYNRVTL